MNKTKFSFFLFFFLSSCYRSTELIGITAYKSNIYKYEIQIKTHTVGRGSMHNLFDFKKYEVNDYEWIYVNRIKGKVLADSLAFTFQQRRIYDPWRCTNLNGYIEFYHDSIYIDLYFYDREGKSSDIPYVYNGKHILKVINDTIPKMDFY